LADGHGRGGNRLALQPAVAIERGDELPPEAQGLLRMQRIRMLQQRQQA
jgi:hypothetical protein